MYIFTCFVISEYRDIAGQQLDEALDQALADPVHQQDLGPALPAVGEDVPDDTWALLVRATVKTPCIWPGSHLVRTLHNPPLITLNTSFDPGSYNNLEPRQGLLQEFEALLG